MSHYSSESLKRIGEKLYKLGGGDLKDLLGDQVQELSRHNYGYYLIYSRIISYYGLDKVLSRIEKRKKLSYNLNAAVSLLLLERLHDPCSKRSNFFHQEEYLGLEQVNLHHIYRCLDQLADHHKLIQQKIYQTGRDSFNQKLDVVFYDVTTFYFDSDKEREDHIAQKGFGKDGKIGNTQVVFAMLIDHLKQPIGYQLYSGKTWEGHTYSDMVERLKKEYDIDKVVLVADRGMLNKSNLEATEKQGYEFIMGERLKSLPAQLQDRLLDLDNYDHQWVSSGSDGIKIRYTKQSYKGRSIIATYSEKRKDKDQRDRERKLEKAELLLKRPSELKKKAQHFFLKTDDDSHYQIDEEKIKRNARFDGFLAIAYNATTLTEQQVLDHYHHLYQIEHSFRTFKSYLETRPMFHWNTKRIQGHICLCYMAYSLLSQLKIRLDRKGTKMTEQQIRDQLDKMQLSEIQQGEQSLYMRSNISEQQKNLLNVVEAKPMPNVFPKNLINKYL